MSTRHLMQPDSDAPELSWGAVKAVVAVVVTLLIFFAVAYRTYTPKQTYCDQTYYTCGNAP